MPYPYKDLNTLTLPSLIERSFSLYKDNILFGKVGGKTITYAEFYQEMQNIVSLLKENGINHGDKVVLLSENMPNWGIVYFAITYFGGVVVPILVDFHPSDIHHILRHSEAKAIFVSRRYIEVIKEATPNDIKLVVNIDDLSINTTLSSVDYLTRFKTQIKRLTNKQEHKPKSEDLAVILYTSGTTGHSKGVMLSHKNLVTNAMSAYLNVNIREEDIFLSILPLAHTLECTVGMIIPILHGSSVYYIDKVPTPSVLLNAMQKVKPTMLISVPLIIEKIYKTKILPNFHKSFIMKLLYGLPYSRKVLHKIAGAKLLESFGGRLRFFAIGGAGLATDVEKFLIEANFPYIIGYGLTETAPLLAGSILGKKPKLGSTGVSMVGVTLKIKDPDPKTGKGEIIAKSPSVMMGYFKNEHQTKEVMEDGWFLTGDLGYLDDEGYLFISGRSKNVLIGSGGENIFPEQVEAIINQNEYVIESLMLMQENKLIAKVHLNYDMLDEKFATNSKTEDKLKDDIEKLLEDIRKDVNSKISSYSKMIKFVEQREPFVKTPTKKIKRYLYQ